MKIKNLFSPLNKKTRRNARHSPSAGYTTKPLSRLAAEEERSIYAASTLCCCCCCGLGSDVYTSAHIYTYILCVIMYTQTLYIGTRCSAVKTLREHVYLDVGVRAGGQFSSAEIHKGV